MGAVKNRNKFPTEVVKSPSLEVFNTQLHRPAQEVRVETTQGAVQHEWFSDSVTRAGSFKIYTHASSEAQKRGHGGAFLPQVLSETACKPGIWVGR